LNEKEGGFTVGVLVQGNYGLRDELRVAGVPVGQEITDLTPKIDLPPHKDGSIIVMVATDAPVLPHQLKRIVKRVALGLGRNGSVAHNASGDIFIAFSTANPDAAKQTSIAQLSMLPNELVDPLFIATVQATEEAVINALVAADTMEGINGNTLYAIPHERLREALRKYNRLVG
jgi:L-aminopeptidase/D-esterase-like protein